MGVNWDGVRLRGCVGTGCKGMESGGGARGMGVNWAGVRLRGCRLFQLGQGARGWSLEVLQGDGTAHSAATRALADRQRCLGDVVLALDAEKNAQKMTICLRQLAQHKIPADKAYRNEMGQIREPLDS